ncbi:MAG: hypothetical protein WBQ89_01775 [Candidatus Acidiferrum sp.]
MNSNEEQAQLVNQPAISSDIKEFSFFGSMSHAWRALRHRNFKLFFAGQSISVIGTWMTRLATAWRTGTPKHIVIVSRGFFLGLVRRKLPTMY